MGYTSFPPWIIGRNSMIAWEAHIVGAEWARKWTRWCATTRAPGTSTPQFTASPLEGWGPHTPSWPTVIRGAGPERPWDAVATEWLQAAPEPHTSWRGDVSSLPQPPPPPASCCTPPTCSEPQRYTHGGATQPPSGGSLQRTGAPSSLWRISQKGGLRTMTPCSS